MLYKSKVVRPILLLFSAISCVASAGVSQEKNNVNESHFSFSSVKFADLKLKSATVGNVCGTDFNGQSWSQVQKENKSDLKNKSSLSRKILNQLSLKKNKAAAVGDGAPGRYYIPVVVHVYGSRFNCDNGGNCLTDEKIIDALNKTNEDFRGLNTQDGPIAEEFQAIRENLDIEFVLAKKDPDGNSTNGIVRYDREQAGYGDGSKFNAQIAADSWDNYKYMNIYFMHDLYDDGKTNNSGVAWYPQVSMSEAGTARVVYNGDYVGTNTSENFRSVLTHEFGHWLNLPHVFDGDSCSVHQEAFCASTGDRVCDTPQMSSSILQGNATNCLGQPTNTENFMHYSNNYAMYTGDQVKRMTAALHGAARATLWSNENLIAVGLEDLTSNAEHPWDGSGVDTKPQGELIKEVENISAQKGETDTVTVDIPVGTEAVAFYLDGYTEDPDLYVSKGVAPEKNGDTWTADFISFRSSGTPELITITGPSNSETYYTTIDAFSDYSNAHLQIIGAEDPTLCDGCERIFLLEEKDLGATKGDEPKTYKVTVPADAVRTIVVIAGGYEGDPDLYVGVNSVPTTETFDCGPFSAPRLSEYCEINSGGELNLLLVPFLDYSGATLTVYYERQVASELPVAEANGPYTGNVGNSIHFSSAGSVDNDGSITGYQWDFGDGNTSNLANPEHAYSSSGEFTATLTVTDNDGNIASDSALVTVNQENQTPTAEANGPYAANTNQVIQFSSEGSIDTDGTILNYHWTFGDGETSNQANPQHAYTSAGIHIAVLTVTDNNGASHSDTAEVTVSDVEYCSVTGNTKYEWIAKVAANGFENTSEADGYADNTSLTIPFVQGDNSIELTAGGNYSEHWVAWIDFDGDGEFNNSNEKVLSGLSGKGTVTGNINIPQGVVGVKTRIRIAMKYHSEPSSACGDMGDGEIEDYSVLISEASNEAPTAKVNGPYSGVVNTGIDFSSEGSTDSDGFIQSYLWDFGDGNSSTDENPTHNYSTSGQYTVTLTVTDDDGVSHSVSTSANVTASANELPDACQTQSPVTGGRLEPGVATCLGEKSVIWLSIGNVNEHQSIAITMGHGQGNLDVLYKNDGWPSDNDFDAESRGATNSECIEVSGDTKYWSYLKISGQGTGATIMVDFDAGCRAN
ncbi:PKD domain-containing protein [Aliikangiella coralliicola]|uniref:PKD domain-containing protein n=1 Tax=Aliikangiella coralliicola TaxID=2592383 RepID=A0A545UEY9_9GAMM|nr:PKD domain-containing protein [Aliikangiella coralliicola]TQV88005.1 PKD domain-containing protein [Aliikangiella coralliicola]